MLIWSHGDIFLYHKFFSRHVPEDPSTLLPLAQLIPSTYYQVKPPPELTSASETLPSDTYVKRVTPVNWDPDEPSSTQVADVIMQEAKTCEKLALHPHRHICECRGYFQKNGFLLGLCFKRHGKNLRGAVRDGDKVDPVSVLEGVRSGIEHIHALGLVHNDINPGNIVLDDESQAIIIDFGSCCSTGSRMISGGTPGWCKDFVFNVGAKEKRLVWI
ncbi:kinase-like domain-containing protein [Amylocystis lapponica]|nr:kinase-like domain-containing protein [Amylocystis lapponica]